MRVEEGSEQRQKETNTMRCQDKERMCKSLRDLCGGEMVCLFVA